MTSVRYPLRGFLVSEMVMFICYVGMWLQDMGGIRGMYDDESYPISLLGMPLIGLLVSALIIVIAVLPCVHLARWIVRREGFTLQNGAWIAFWISLLLGGFLGLLRSDLISMAFGALYLGLGTFAFWVAAVDNKAGEVTASNQSTARMSNSKSSVR